MKNHTDLIRACKAKSQQAEKELFLCFAARVLTICRRYASQDAEAQDFMQECFISVFEKIKTYDEKKGSFEGWLYRVSTNTILQILRKTKRNVTIVFPKELPEQTIEQEDFETIPNEVILSAIQQLPPGYKEVLNLYIFEGWSHREIADSLDITASASRSQLTRAKRILKQILQKKINQRYEKRLA